MIINVDDIRTNAPEYNMVREELSERIIAFERWAGTEINKLSGAIETDRVGQRLGVAFALVVAEHADTVAQCIRVGNYASALAIWRPMFEAVIKLAKVDLIHNEDRDRLQRIVRSQPGVDKKLLDDLRTAGGPDMFRMWNSIAEWANNMCHGCAGQLNSNRITGGFEANYPGQWVWMAGRTAGPAASFGYAYIAKQARAVDLCSEILRRTRTMFTGRLQTVWNGMVVEMYSRAEESNGVVGSAACSGPST